MGGGPKVPYPKHVWSPAGGWYAQPNNWKANTLIVGAVMASIAALTWKFSAGRERWSRTPEPQGWYPSRNWSKHLQELDAERDAAAAKKS